MEPAGNCENVDWSTTVRFLFGDTFHISLSRVPLSAEPVIFTSKTPCSVLALVIFWAIVVNSCAPCPGVGVGVGVGFFACGVLEPPQAKKPTPTPTPTPGQIGRAHV